jgi:hypothetical protein
VNIALKKTDFTLIYFIRMVCKLQFRKGDHKPSVSEPWRVYLCHFRPTAIRRAWAPMFNLKSAGDGQSQAVEAPSAAGFLQRGIVATNVHFRPLSACEIGLSRGNATEKA